MEHANVTTTTHAPAHEAPAAAVHDRGHGSGDAHGGEGAHHSGLSYYAVFGILFVVTVLEVGLAYLDLNKVLKISLFVVMALYKAVMVALYFMHLKFERKTMWLIASAPLIFGVILAIGAYPDSEKGTSPFRRGDLDPWKESTPPPNPGHE
jgi:cytochrome c oxidase subunit 4